MTQNSFSSWANAAWPRRKLTTGIVLASFWLAVFGSSIFIASTVFTSQAEAASAAKTPTQVVQQGIDDLTLVLEKWVLEEQALKENNLKKSSAKEQDYAELYKAINASLEPIVDFRYISARVMGGRYFKAATPAQRREFAQVFQSSLVKTFAKGLMEFDYQEFELNLLEKESRYEDQDTVSLDVIASDGKRYPVSFSLRLHNAEWKIINLIVNGVNLGLTFNSQFDRAMRENQRDFDKVIADWNPENALEEIQEQEAPAANSEQKTKQQNNQQ